MSEVDVERVCPGCNGTLVWKNGFAGGQQYFKCGIPWCGQQFREGPEGYYHRFSAELIAFCITLRFWGMPYGQIVYEAMREFDVSDTRISEATVFNWVDRYVNLALDMEEKWTLGASPQKLILESVPLHPADGVCWVIRDLGSSCVLAAQVSGTFNSAAAAEVIKKLRASTMGRSDEASSFSFMPHEDIGNTRGHAAVLKAVKRQFPSADYIPPEEILAKDFILGRGGAFSQALQTMRNRKAFRSLESREKFLNGRAVMYNFVIRTGDWETFPPTQGEGFWSWYKCWLFVVKSRPKDVFMRTILGNGRRVDPRRVRNRKFMDYSRYFPGYKHS